MLMRVNSGGSCYKSNNLITLQIYNNMANKTLSTRISPEVEDFLAKEYGTASSGLSACATEMYFIRESGGDVNNLRENIDIFSKIRVYSKIELKGKFTKEEWVFFADSLNGSLIDSTFRCNVGALIAHCEDSERFEGTASKYNLKVEDICSKVSTLTGAQVDALYTHVESMWNENKDLEIWSKELV